MECEKPVPITGNFKVNEMALLILGKGYSIFFHLSNIKSDFCFSTIISRNVFGLIFENGYSVNKNFILVSDLECNDTRIIPFIFINKQPQHRL